SARTAPHPDWRRALWPRALLRGESQECRRAVFLEREQRRRSLPPWLPLESRPLPPEGPRPRAPPRARAPLRNPALLAEGNRRRTDRPAGPSSPDYRSTAGARTSPFPARGARAPR